MTSSNSLKRSVPPPQRKFLMSRDGKRRNDLKSTKGGGNNLNNVLNLYRISREGHCKFPPCVCGGGGGYGSFLGQPIVVLIPW